MTPDLGPFSGPKTGTRFSLKPGTTFEALATLRWDRLLATANTEGSLPLRINMDESSVKLWPGARPGNVVRSQGALFPSPAPEQAVPLRARRSAVTLVAFVCDDDAVQRLLPQFIITNERQVTPAMARRWVDGGHGPVRLLRHKSAWIRGADLQRILRCVASAIKPVVEDRRVILSMDACPVHLCPAVLRTSGQRGMHFLPVAA